MRGLIPRAFSGSEFREPFVDRCGQATGGRGGAGLLEVMYRGLESIKIETTHARKLMFGFKRGTVIHEFASFQRRFSRLIQ